MEAVKNGRCNQCEIMYINGIRCHEEGCPVAWKDKKRECLWCGGEFESEDKYQTCCDESCGEAYYSEIRQWP